MTTALMEKPIASVSVTPDQLDLVKRTVASGATDAELKLYLYDCQRQGVHPLDRLLHFTKRGGKYTPVTSIDLMRIRAAETGEYAGSDDAVFTSGGDGAAPAAVASASVTVWRLVQSQRCAFTATARWDEYYPGDQGGHMWRKMPHTMLAKCAEALALRKGFPRQLAGLYAAEEMDQANSERASSSGRTSVAPIEDTGSIPAARSTIDTETGEELPPAPAGYHYVANYDFKSPWHEAFLMAWDAQGGALKVSTKLKIGELLAQAAADHVPVKADVTVKQNGRGEAYLNKLTLYKAPKDELDQRREITSDDIPF